MLDTGFLNQVNNGNILILPENGELVFEEWKGYGYVKYKQRSSRAGSVGMIIGGGYNGGFAGVKAPVDVMRCHVEFIPEIRHPWETKTFRSQDPVDLSTGAYLFDHEDLALGGAEPNGLHFSRSYNSDRHSEKGPLGYGWKHNYDIYIDIHSDVESGLGMRHIFDAAPLIVSSFVTFDLIKPTTPTLKEWVTSALINQWAMDQLFENAATVHLQNKRLTFIEMPDGTYSSPPGVTTKLIKDSGTGLYRLEERFGTVINFDANNKISSWTDVDGNQMTFTYNGTELQTVRDNFGRTLTLNHAGGFLDSVDDSAGRSVSFTYDANGDLTTYTDPESKPWGYGYSDPIHPHRSVGHHQRHQRL